MSYNRIVSLLGSEISYLLNNSYKSISKEAIRKPNPNYKEDSISLSRKPQVLRSLSDFNPENIIKLDLPTNRMLANRYNGKIGLINSKVESGTSYLDDAVKTVVINERKHEITSWTTRCLSSQVNHFGINQ